MGSREKLPDGWIRKESRSRPNNFYYFNTTTGKSQWVPPAIANESGKEIKDSHNEHTKVKTAKYDEQYKSHSAQNQTRIKINEKSKERKQFFPFSKY